MKAILLLVSHALMLFIGLALGLYLLPILTAPPSPDSDRLAAMAQGAAYSGELTRELRGSDFLHWGEGTLSVSPARIVHEGKLAPGPDYRLYLLEDFVEHEDEFLPLKDRARLVGDVKSFDGFILDVPADVDVAKYTTAVVWCEAFGEFITATRYR
ncbi:MAG: DM13 domain-containing protein [Xanthomonadales bacterium]|jgi:hypothetical protein|nr:DM13 domain-containing protein [Xanthomonadales bacterium]